MAKVEYVKPNFSKDAFAGTAAFYVRYRLPYPAAMLRDLAGRARLSGGGNLLDLACGPGRLTLAMAGSFRETWAIDREPEMIDQARQEAARRGAGDIRWIVGTAETLEAPGAHFEMITIGEAFQRLDQEAVAKLALRWLKPGGHMVTMGNYSILGCKEPWQRVVVDAVNKWTARGSRDGGGPAPARPGSGPEHDEAVMRDQGFVDVGSHRFEEPHDWTIEAVLGYLYSTSVCSRNRLGACVNEFEEELRAALLAADGSGIYRETISWGYTMGAKPGGRE